MRKLLIVVAGVAMILGIVSASLWRQLRSERVVFADMRTELDDARARLRMPAPAPMAVSASAPVPVATVAAAQVPACKPATPLPVASPPPVDFNRVVTQNIAVTQRDLLKDPEYRKARMAQGRLDAERSNPGVAEALGLSAKEASKFFDLLAENQIRQNELPPVTVDPANPLAASEEMGRNRQALMKQQEESLGALLGSSGVAQWQEYQLTRGARSQAASMGTQLLQMGLPLTSAQLKPLTTVLMAEQQRQRQEAQLTARTVVPADPQARAAMQDEAQKRNDENNRRMLTAISSSLSPQQLAVFREQFETQEAMNAATARARDRAMAARSVAP